MKALELTGKVFGRLTGVRRTGTAKNGQSIWLWSCSCGKSKEITASQVIECRTKSCGCLQSESRTKHGMYGTRTYRAWQNMKARVAGNSDSSEKYYAERGIVVCERWASNFDAFLEDMGECPNGLTLDRKSSDGNYEPGNCRWATSAEQSANTRRSHSVVLRGKEMCLAHACKEIGGTYRTLMKYMAKGMTAQDALDRYLKES